jgi:uncharacterized protein YndB with AHSA1/START domain
MKRITMERTFDAAIEDVWELWTTKEGIEQWWGPEGFAVTVTSIDLRPGGELRYDMRAVQPEMVAYMEREGMPTTTHASVTYTEVIAPKRLAYLHKMDFVPGIEPYDVATEIDLLRVPDGVRMVMRFDAMHDETWTQRAVMGWESELGRLAKLLESRK